MIPEEKKAAVAHALQATFGVNEFEEISQLTVGLSSALIFKIVVKGKPYLLRVITRTDAVSDPAHYYSCMKPAAEAGHAPHVWYAGIEDRISITDFIEAKPFPISDAAEIMPDLLRRLHSLPPFPFRINYLDSMDGFIQKFKAAKIVPESATEEAFQQYERIKAVYPRNTSEYVSCHNDLKPENILFDGNRVWLVDWEAAFLNDPYMDLAVVANFIAMDDAGEKDYLERYFGEEVGEYRYARFFLMRQMLHLFYFTVFLLFRTPGAAPIDLNLTIPGFREFHNDIWTGKIDLGNNSAKQLYALVHLEQFKHNLRLKRFDNSLSVVSNQQLL